MMGMAKGRIAAMDIADRLAWAKCQVYIMLANAVNAAKALGFDSCPMTGFNPDQYATSTEATPSPRHGNTEVDLPAIRAKRG